MPGPLLAVNITESGRCGFRAGPLVVVGHGLVEIALVVAVLSGLGPLLERESFVAVIGLLGGLFLLWMGYSMIRTAPQQVLPQYTNSISNNTNIIRPILAGAGASMSNPYWWLWWATVGLTYMLWSRELGMAAVMLFCVGHILADLLWYSGISALVATGRQWITDGFYHLIMTICGVFLIGLAVYFVISGIGFLTQG